MFALICLLFRCLRDILLSTQLPLTKSNASGIPLLYFGTISGSSVAIFFVIVIVVLCLLGVLYAPLPKGITDKKRLRFWETLIRLSIKYLGGIVGRVAGERARNTVIRIFIGLPYVVRKPPKWCTVREQLISGVKCRVYVPEASHLKSKGVIVFVHGGGWCVLRPSHYDGAVYAIIKRVGVVAVSVDYRRAPEACFPAPIDDCEAVVRAIYEDEHKRLGVDRHRIAVMGESAGGNLATVVCQRLLRQNKSYVRCQVLVNPVIHALDFRSPSYQEYRRSYSDSALLSPSLLAMWYLLYLGIEPTRKNIRSVVENRHLSAKLLSSQEIRSFVDVSHLPANITSKHRLQQISSPEPDEELAERFSKLITADLCPLLGEELHKMPPAFIATMETDIVRDEGILYAKRLQSFNVRTEWKHYDRGYHGILQMPGSKLRDELIDDAAAFLRTSI